MRCRRNGNGMRNCADCVHAKTFSAPDPDDSNNTVRRVRCDAGQWAKSVKLLTLMNNTVRYAKIAEGCKEFQEAGR